MADKAQIVALDQKLAAKQREGADLLASAWDETTKSYLPEKRTAEKGGSMSTSAWGEKIRSIKAEAEAIGLERETMMLAYQAESEFKRKQPAGGTDDPDPRGVDPEMEEKGKTLVKTLGQCFVEHPTFKANHRRGDSKQPWGIHLPDVDVKTTLTIGSSWAPQAIRTGKIVEFADRPLDLIDTMPMDTTDQTSVVYMEETTQTLTNIVEKAEAAAYGEAAWALTQRSVTVENLPAILPVTDQALEDIDGLSGWIDRKMRYSLLRRLNFQLINGTGVSPLLVGVTAVSGLQTQALGTYPVPDALMRGMTKVRVTGQAIPSAVWMHPTDVQNLMLLRDGLGNYLWGKPSEAGPKFIWGCPIAETQGATQGTSIVGAYRDFSRIVTRKGVTVEVGWNSTDWSLGQRTVRANMRLAIVWERGAAFCTVTGLPA